MTISTNEDTPLASGPISFGRISLTSDWHWVGVHGNNLVTTWPLELSQRKEVEVAGGGSVLLFNYAL